MLDPFTAIGLTANLLAFAQIGLKIINASYKIYKTKDGALEDLTKLEDYAAAVQQCNSKLGTTNSVNGLTDIDLIKLREQTNATKEIVLGILSTTRDLRISSKPSIWRAFTCACRIWYRSGILNKAQRRLEGILQLSSHCLNVILR